MRNVVYCAPFIQFATTRRFAEALAGLRDVRLFGVFQTPPDAASASLFTDVALVGDATDTRALVGAIEKIRARYGPPFRILGILENLQTQLAEVRMHFGLPGPDPATTERFRDKSLMKRALRAHGLPCAAHAVVRSVDDAVQFARRVGFPLVLKPPAGAGCKATWRVDSPAMLDEALADCRPAPGREVLAEEFLTGAEHSFETLCIGGTPVFHSISRYFPGPLEVTQNPHLQWVCLLPRDISGPEYDRAREVGFAAVQRLGMDTGLTHMEWFQRPDGTVAIGEIAMRPPGAQIVRLMSLAHEADLHRAWARAVVDGAFDGPWVRRWATAVAFLRGAGDGRVARVDGVDEAQRAVGDLVVEARLPVIGAPRADGYEGDGYVLMRHPDTETLKAAVRHVIETVRVSYA
jgi:formate-dependent phosphoribosylglycinamide formyltransferase (GAR transformylase)